MERLAKAIRTDDPEAWKHYATMVHQVAQSRPSDLREFVMRQDVEAIQYWEVLSPLFVLIWRIIGHEYREELGAVAIKRIMFLCDMDEYLNATEALTDPSSESE
jgi:hypothetical protein